MGRLVLGTIIGAVAWLATIVALSVVLRFAWPEMAAVRDMTQLTLPMQITRLVLSAVGSIVGGAIAARVGRDVLKASLGAGLLLLLVFVPYHLTIWQNFPVWYHLTFFASLPLLSLLGGRLSGSRRAA